MDIKQIYYGILRGLDDCIWAEYREYKKAETAIDNIEKYRVALEQHYPGKKKYIHSARGLVWYPNLLLRFLKLSDLCDGDLAAMLCRSVERPHLEAFEILLAYAVEKQQFPRLLLLPQKVDLSLYSRLQAVGICDPHFDGCAEYQYTLDLDQIDKDNGYSGYREAFHILTYAGPKRYVLADHLRKYSEYPPPCIVEAVYDYFGLDKTIKSVEDEKDRANRAILHIEKLTMKN